MPRVRREPEHEAIPDEIRYRDHADGCARAVLRTAVHPLERCQAAVVVRRQRLCRSVGDGPAQGATVVDRRGPFIAKSNGSAQAVPEGFAPWELGLEVDVAGFRAQLHTLFS